MITFSLNFFFVLKDILGSVYDWMGPPKFCNSKQTRMKKAKNTIIFTIFCSFSILYLAPSPFFLKTEKHRRDGMSRLGTSRNVRWSAEGVTNSLCSRAYNLVNLSSLRWEYFDERTKKMKEIFLRKMKNVFLAETRSVILLDGNFVSTKSSLHTCLSLWGRMAFVSIFSSEKNEPHIWSRSWNIRAQVKKNQETFLKKIEVILTEKRRRHTWWR